jgi:nitroreductase
MEVQDAIRTLLAVRSYQERPVPEDVLQQILEAGRLSASAMNKQPWHFVVVREPATLKELGQLASTGPYIANAPLAIVVAITPSRFAISDASRAIQDMMLAAWSAGVGSNWVGAGGLDEVKSLLGIPANIDILAILPFGYPAERIGQGHKERKSLNEIVHWERWEQG